MRPAFILFIGFSNLVLSPSALAQVVIPTIEQDDEEEKHEGWKNRARVSANVSFNDVRNVVGTVEGSTWQIGALINADAHLREAKHDWENTLAFNFTQTRNPALEEFVKSADELKISTAYLYHIAEYLGPFAQASAATAVAPGFDVRASPFQTVVPEDVGVTGETVPAGGRFRLTDPFEPLSLSESVGGFAIASDTKLIRSSFKLGLGGEHVFTFGDDALVLDDDEDTPEIEYAVINSANQAGVAFNANLDGLLREGVTYNVSSKVFYALASDDDAISGSDRLSVEVDATLSVAITSWASLDYVLLLRRIPWIVEANQITNGLILSIGYDLIGSTASET